jgi:hypothetical protein
LESFLDLFGIVSSLIFNKELNGKVLKILKRDFTILVEIKYSTANNDILMHRAKLFIHDFVSIGHKTFHGRRRKRA